jgi:shikimate kinase
MILKLRRTPGIYLVGFMGAGKSTVGRMLADEIGWRFGDVDDDIEARQRRTIQQLFADLGEEEFRRMEHDAIAGWVRGVRSGNPLVLSLGGGAFTRSDNIDLLCENGVTIWLDTSFSIVRRRVSHSNHRPLARDPRKFEQLYHDRREQYAKADYRVELNQDNSRLAVEKILGLKLLD